MHTIESRIEGDSRHDLPPVPAAPMSKLTVWALSISGLACLFTAGCSSGTSGFPLPWTDGSVSPSNGTTAGTTEIGPAGGVVQETDPSRKGVGVKVTVAPGAWTRNWRVSIRYVADSDKIPEYPEGFVPLQGAQPAVSEVLEIRIIDPATGNAAPKPLPMKISFPLSMIQTQPGPLDVRSAFFYDDDKESWGIVFPRELTADALVVETDRHDWLWSWGYSTVGVADYDLYIKPAMDAHFGVASTDAMQAKFASIRSQAEAKRFAFTCAGLAGAASFVAAIKQEAYSAVDRVQASYGCGPCNPLTSEFKEGFEEYWDKVGWLETALTVSDLLFPPKKAIDLVTLPLMNEGQDLLFDALAPDTPCDYRCYFEKDQLELDVWRAVYHGSDWVYKAIEKFRTEQLKC
jgi:hypothetical protein